MRLIDADKLTREVLNLTTTESNAGMLRLLTGLINDAPTATRDVATMRFREAFFEMLNGKHIAHELWKGGYWAWENNTIMIHCYDGRVLDIRETENTAYTFGFIVEDRWYVKE